MDAFLWRGVLEHDHGLLQATANSEQFQLREWCGHKLAASQTAIPEVFASGRPSVPGLS